MFTPEDGTGLVDANAYLLVEFADNFASDRQVSAWVDATQQSKETAIIVVTDYVDARFGGKFNGCKLNSTQRLEFPRNIFGLPEKLKEAVAFYCFLEITGLFIKNTEIDTTGKIIVEKGVKLGNGAIEELSKYATSTQSPWVQYPLIDSMLLSYLNNYQNRVIR